MDKLLTLFKNLNYLINFDLKTGRDVQFDIIYKNDETSSVIMTANSRHLIEIDVRCVP